MAGTSKGNPDGYVHARDAREYQRLRNQARLWQAATETTLDAAGLAPGMSCLDVGAGPGAVMRVMAGDCASAAPGAARVAAKASRNCLRSIIMGMPLCDGGHAPVRLRMKQGRYCPYFSRTPRQAGPMRCRFCCRQARTRMLSGIAF